MTVRWAIMGTGGIAQVFAEALGRVDGATLTAVASRDGARAEAFAAGYRGAVGYGSYQEMLAAQDIDIVYVATPQHRHAGDALDVLASGKHTLVEKPLVLDSAAAEAIAAAAAERGLLALEGMWTLFNPLIERLLDEVGSGRLGALRSFTANTGPIGVPVGHRALTADLGASLLWECLVYPVAILTAIAPGFAEPDHVHAVSLMREKGFDEASAVLLASGTAFAQFSGAFAPGSAEAASSRVQLGFENGWVEVSELYNPSRLRIGWNDGRVEEHDADADQVGFGYEILAVNRAIEGLAVLPERVRLAHTIGNIALLERIRASALELH
jgi:predicted dehydrogenase